MDFDTIRTYVQNGNFTLLKRNQEVNDAYINYKTNILQEWVSIEDIIKVKYLGASFLINPYGLKYAIEINQPRYSLQPNKYPYDINKNIKHMVLWATVPLNFDEIESILIKELNQKFFWFEQNLINKSVKGIWHVHVFVRN